MNNQIKAWALVPVKGFKQAKSRLGSVLPAEQCAQLAINMARDVIVALQNAENVEGITILGDASEIEDLAREIGCNHLADDAAADLSSNLTKAAQILTTDGVSTLLILPSDLPTLRGEDIDELLVAHEDGLTLCFAERDGGTNAMVITPPDAIQFRFGDRSGERHLAAGRVAGLMCKKFTSPAFDHDIDIPADLLWYCRQKISGRTADYLGESGIRARLLKAKTPSLAEYV